MLDRLRYKIFDCLYPFENARSLVIKIFVLIQTTRYNRASTKCKLQIVENLHLNCCQILQVKKQETFTLRLKGPLLH